MNGLANYSPLTARDHGVKRRLSVHVFVRCFCLFVCWQLCMKTADPNIFMKILPEFCL